MKEGIDISDEETLNTLIHELERLKKGGNQPKETPPPPPPQVQVVCTEDNSQAEKDPTPEFHYPANNDIGEKVVLRCGDLRGLVPDAWLSSALIELYSV